MTIHAPFNFVPLSSKVVVPAWGSSVSHDLPFKDGASGVLSFTLTNDTELIVGDGNSPQEVNPFTLPDGRAAIPGSSLRGMIRAVLEVATFSRFRQVDDSRFGVRDLTPGARPFYGDVISQNIDGVFKARSQAGWLSFDGRQWLISPCELARIEHNDLATLTGDPWWEAVPKGDSAGKYEKFDAWAAQHGVEGRKIYFRPGPLDIHQHSRVRLRYRRASDLSATAGNRTEGTLVFTGQPGPRVPGQSGKKHLEFIFFGGGAPIQISDAVMNGFLQIHENSTEWKRMQNDISIPVFYLESESAPGHVESLGLALMYKLAYKKTVHDVVRHTSPAHLEAAEPDFCDLLFGRTDDAQDASLKSRAWFEPAVAHAVAPLPVRDVVLSSPKPSYYPSYVRQNANGGLLSGDYTTWSNDTAQVRGWKRYPARAALTAGAPATDRVTTKLHPLPSGTRFDCRLVFHNLRREELGAIVWALTWGGQPSLRHSLGMGKPYGYGSVRFALDDSKPLEIEWNDPRRSEVPTVGNLSACFTEFMTGQVPGWSATPQMKALTLMANPATATTVDLTYMTLDPERRRNDFQDAKKQRQVLPEYPGVPGVPHAPAPAAPRTPTPPQAPNVEPTEDPFWPGVPLTLGREGGALTVTATNGHKVANETVKLLRERLTDEGKAALESAEKRWKKNKPVTADVTVDPLGGSRYRIINLVFKQ